MHGILIVNIVLALELLLLIAAMHLMAKAITGTYGRFFNFMSKLIVVLSIGLMICTATTSICRHFCHKQKSECTEMEMEKCMSGGMGHHCMMMKMHGGCDMEGMGEGASKEKMEGCKDMDKKDCPFDKSGKCTGDEKKCKMDMDKPADKDGDAKKTK